MVCLSMLFQSDDFLVAFTNRSAHVQTSGYSGSQNIVLVLPLNNHHFDLEKGAGYKLSQEIMTKLRKKQLSLYCSNTPAEPNVFVSRQSSAPCKGTKEGPKGQKVSKDLARDH